MMTEQTSARVSVEREGPVAVVVIASPGATAGSGAVRRGLMDAVRLVASDRDVIGAVMIGAGRSFAVGCDLGDGTPADEAELSALIAAIEGCAKPFVAALDGTALGGGLELALGCDARVATPDAVVGLPEVRLGVIPGAGGTQRLPRLVGLSNAIDLIGTGRKIDAREAHRLGLIDALFEDDLRPGAVAYARALAGTKRRVTARPVPLEAEQAVETAAEKVLQAGRRRPPVVEAIRAVRAAIEVPVDEALAAERAAFDRLSGATEALALRHLAGAERAAADAFSRQGGTPRPIERVAVIGGGTMGTGIAIAVADAGLPVTLIEQDRALLDRAIARLRDHYAQRSAKGRLTRAEAGARIGRITPKVGIDGLAEADLVIEAVFEDIAVKQDVFRQLDAAARPGAVLASNTSYLDLDAIAAATGRPQDVVGLHFFSPAQVMRLLEVVRGAATGPAVLATAQAFATRLGKIAVLAGNGFGFIGNRVFAAYRRQCEFMLEEGALPDEIDAAVEAFGFAMGPFAVADLAGLDIAWRIRRQQAATRDPRARYVEIADILCEHGRLGQKSGAGYYRYRNGARRGEPDPAVRDLAIAASARKGIARRKFRPDEITRRALLAMANEAALLLAEAIAERASDIDVVLVNGYGFPKHEGGPVFWARRQDQAALSGELARLAEVSGFGFRCGNLALLREHS